MLTPPKSGRMPIASVASDPRLAWMPYWVSRLVLATCAQASRPPRRTPVSSLCSTGARRSAALTAAPTGATTRAACCTQPTSAPRASRTPARSASSCCTRPKGTNCACTRYTASARNRGPYWARLGASGGKVPMLTTWQAGQRTCSARCSVICSRTGGSSHTWRRSCSTTAASSSAAWHCAQTAGRCSTTASGTATRCSVAPRCPQSPQLPARLLAARLPQALGLALESIIGGRLGAIAAVFGQSCAQLLDLGRQRHHLLAQHRELAHLLLQGGV